MLNEDSLTSYILRKEAMQEAERSSELLPQANNVAPTKQEGRLGQRGHSGGGGGSSGKLAKDTNKKKSAQDGGREGGSRRQECWICHSSDHLSLEYPKRMVVLDSSCSHHLMGTKEAFVDLGPSGDIKLVRGFNGALQDVRGRDTDALHGQAGKQVLIADVLYVPSVHANLLSAGQLKENGVKLQKDGDGMLLVSATGDILGRATYSGRVLCSDLRPCSVTNAAEAVALRAIILAPNEAQGRHRAGAQVGIRRRLTMRLVHCREAGAAHLPDKGSDAADALAIVHIDLCGPFWVAAKDGSLYFLLLKDRYVWVRPVAKKSDVLRDFEKWLVSVERKVVRPSSPSPVSPAPPLVADVPELTSSSTSGDEGSRERTAGEDSAEMPTEVQQGEAIEDGGEQSDAAVSTDTNVVEFPHEPQRLGRAWRPLDFLYYHACVSPAAYTTAYDNTDDDLLYDDAEQDEELWKGKAVKAPMEEEIRSLIGIWTWELVERPPGVNIMKNWWVLTMKYRIDDTIKREKARLVVKGFTQVCGADCDKTYAPVSSYVTLRIFLGIVAVLDFNLKNAFLQSKLDRVLYMYQPDYFNDETGPMCKLLRSLYGLKKSPRCGTELLTQDRNAEGAEGAAGGRL
ncbi:unnamed protein product [Closterium sp. NIES-53]